MKNKLKDVPYCGVRKQKIADFPIENINLNSLDILLHFVRERYKIHLRKDVYKKPAPWTKDEILKNFRFTNIRREHDRETRWLIKHITDNRNLSYEDKLLNCILFRLFNKYETSELIDAPIEFSRGYDPEDYRHAFVQAQKKDPHRVFFTGAFYTTGMKQGLKAYMPEDVSDTMEMRVMYFMKYLSEEGICNLTSDSIETPKDMYDLLKSYTGIGEFLAYQIFVDMTYIKKFPFSENEFTIAGTGAKLGLKFLFNDTAGLTHSELIFWLRDNWKALNQYNIQHGNKNQFNPQKRMIDLPEYDRVMNVMSLENCMCEFSKYYRAYNNTGRPRKKYHKGG